MAQSHFGLPLFIPDPRLDLSLIPPPWRLVHLGQSSSGEWSCELTSPSIGKDGWYCACSYHHSSAKEAFAAAIHTVISQTAEFRKFELGVYHLNTGARAAPAPIPTPLEDL